MPTVRRVAVVLTVAAVLAGAAALSGCQALIEVPADTDGDSGEFANTSPDEVEQIVGVSRSPLRHLTRKQLGNALRDLLGVDPSVSQTLTPDELVGPFESNSVTPLSESVVDQYSLMAEDIADSFNDWPRILPCAIDSVDDACVETFVRDFGLKVFRRPLTDEEAGRYELVYANLSKEIGKETAVRTVLQAFLQSPNFVYHMEDQDDDPAVGLNPLDGYRLASRLSFFLWNTMPDETLFTLAEDGQLLEQDVLSTEVERLLSDPKFDSVLREFHNQWLEVKPLLDMDKHESVYPGFDQSVAQSIVDDLGRFVAHVMKHGSGTMDELFTSTLATPNEKTAQIYGLTLPESFAVGDAIQAERERAGLLTHPALLAANAHSRQTSPVHRGVVIRENFMCQFLQPPPPDADTTPPAFDPEKTTRDQFEAHTDNDNCSGCHKLIDPLGLGLEGFDAIGAFREFENDIEVDTSGEVIGSGDVDGEFDGARELALRLSDSASVRGCVTKQWFRFATGRMEGPAEDWQLDELLTKFDTSGTDVRELLRDIVMSKSFRNRTVLRQVDEGGAHAGEEH